MWTRCHSGEFGVDVAVWGCQPGALAHVACLMASAAPPPSLRFTDARLADMHALNELDAKAYSFFRRKGLFDKDFMQLLSHVLVGLPAGLSDVRGCFVCACKDSDACRALFLPACLPLTDCVGGHNPLQDCACTVSEGGVE